MLAAFLFVILPSYAVPKAALVFGFDLWSVAVASSPQQTKRQTIGNSTGQNGELTSNRSILLLVGLLVVVFFVFGYLNRVNDLAAVRSAIVSLQDDVAQAEQRNAELEATLNEVAGQPMWAKLPGPNWG